MAHTAADLYPDWPRAAARIRDAVAALDASALALRAGPEHGAIWALAAHTAGARVFWLAGVFGEPWDRTDLFPDPASGFGWEDEPEHPRDGSELADALDASWALVASCLARWDAGDLEVAAERGGRPHSRASVLNRLFSHDAFHAGEISQLLGSAGRGEIDLWRRG